MIDISRYMLKPITIHVADGIDITSPVPSVATGKLLAAYQAVQAEQTRRAQAGEPLLEGDAALPDEWPETTEELATLVLGRDEWDRLVAMDAPEAYIAQAASAAVVCWATGGDEEAVNRLYEISMGDGGSTAPKGNRAQRRSKSGRATA